MNRLLSLSLLTAAVAIAPAQAQETPTDTTEIPVDPTTLTDVVDADSADAVIEPDPERARELYDEGRGQLQAGSFEEALLKFEEALLYNDSYAAAALGRGQALAQLSRLEDARTALESAVAMAEASDAASAADIVRVSRRTLEQINSALEAQTQRQAQAQAASAAADRNQKVQQAIDLLQANPVDAASATEAYALLEQARMAGYNPDDAAFYYAKALNAMDRGADAVPYAQTAVEASAGQADRSPYYIQLGLAHMSAGNADDARAAFEAVNEGDSWHGWAQHYIGQLDAAATGTEG